MTKFVFPSPYGENYFLTLASENRINTSSPRQFAAEKKKLIIFRSFFRFSRKSDINVFIAHIISGYSDRFHDNTGTHLVKSSIVLHVRKHIEVPADSCKTDMHLTVVYYSLNY